LAGGGAGLRWFPVAGGKERKLDAQAKQGKTWPRRIEWALHIRSSFIISDHVSDFSSGRFRWLPTSALQTRTVPVAAGFSD
jgi:hypothetical protein